MDKSGPASDMRGATIAILAEAPDEMALTKYDASHFLTYARLIDAELAGIDWREAASAILLCAVEHDPGGTHKCWASHLARAHWIVDGFEGKPVSS
jgi:hypothetical protein